MLAKPCVSVGKHLGLVAGPSSVTTFMELFHSFFPKIPAREKAMYCERVTEGTCMVALANGCKRLQSEFVSDFDFFKLVLPSLEYSASRLPTLFPDTLVPLLPQGYKGSVAFSPAQSHALLSAGMLGLLYDTHAEAGYGTLDFTSVNCSRDPVACQRVTCQLAYFDQCLRWAMAHSERADASVRQKELPDRIRIAIDCLPQQPCITFERVVLRPAEEPDWCASEIPLVVGERAPPTQVPGLPAMPPKLRATNLFVHFGVGMEDVKEADSNVDFANKQLHIGCIIPSCTQEEVMFSIRPDLFISLLVFQTLASNEAALMFGCQRHCNYSGYLESFKFCGTVSYDPFAWISKEGKGEVESPEAPANPSLRPPPSIIAIDAIVNRGDQFLGPAVRRDLLKVYAGFSRLATKRIATGNWGCGAFRGDPTLKFLQQLMAAAVCPVSQDKPLALDYCIFSSQAQAEKFANLTQALMERGVTVKQAYEWISEYSSQRGYLFEEFIDNKLNLE